MSVQSDLAKLAKCYCFDNDMAKKVIIYLLASKAGLLAMTPTQLASAAKCYCFDDDTWKKIVAYLLNAGGGGGGGGGNSVFSDVQGATPSTAPTTAGMTAFNENTNEEWFVNNSLTWQRIVGA